MFSCCFVYLYTYVSIWTDMNKYIVILFYETLVLFFLLSITQIFLLEF